MKCIDTKVNKTHTLSMGNREQRKYDSKKKNNVYCMKENLKIHRYKSRQSMAELQEALTL